MKKVRDRTGLNLRLLGFIGGLLLLSIVFEVEKISAQLVEEYRVKAALILNCARFTQWPDNAFAGADEPCDLCVVGDTALEASFRTVNGKDIGSRQLRVRFMRGAGDFQGCDAVFISKDVDRSTALRILADIRDRPVLTIGEMTDFARCGGVINFFNREGRLRLEINPGSARRQGLKLSSRLLKLAVIVGDE